MAECACLQRRQAVAAVKGHMREHVCVCVCPDLLQVPLTARGWQQALEAGEKIRAHLEEEWAAERYQLHFYTSPYLRSKQTYEGLVQAFDPEQVWVGGWVGGDGQADTAGGRGPGCTGGAGGAGGVCHGGGVESSAARQQQAQGWLGSCG